MFILHKRLHYYFHVHLLHKFACLQACSCKLPKAITRNAGVC